MESSLVLYYVIGIAATFAAAGIGYWVSVRFNKEIPQWVFCALIVFSLYLFFVHFLKYRGLHFFVDYSHWLQIVSNIASSGKPFSLNHEFFLPGTLNYFSVHFTPFIYVFGLLFALFPFGGTLSVFNVAFLVSSGIPLYLLARRMGFDRRFCLFTATLLLWYPTFQYITLYEFEMLRFSIPMLLWMLYFWESRRTVSFFLLVIMAIFVREEVGLTIAAFGAYLFLFERERIKGLLTFLLGLGGFIFILKVLMPFFSPAPEFSHIVGGLGYGDTFFEIIKNIVLQNGLPEATLLNPIKWANLFMLFAPFLFVSALAPSALISILPNIGTGLVSYSLAHSSYMLYYISPSIPFIVYAFLKAWPKLIRFLERVFSLEGSRAHAGAMSAVLFAIISSNVFFGPSPLSLQFWFKHIRPAPFNTQNFHWSSYKVTSHHEKARGFADEIPDDAIVSTQAFLQTLLFEKRGVMVFPQLVSKDGRYEAEYVLLDETNNGLNPGSPAFVSSDQMSVIRKDEKWQLVDAEDGYLLYKAGER